MRGCERRDVGLDSFESRRPVPVLRDHARRRVYDEEHVNLALQVRRWGAADAGAERREHDEPAGRETQRPVDAATPVGRPDEREDAEAEERDTEDHEHKRGEDRIPGHRRSLHASTT
ncbi:hypothetical protein ACFPRL_31280 [Pseudoclavibacter helvolus]